MLLSIVLTFVFLSANVLSTDFSKLLTRQPNSIVVHAKGFSTGGGFKSGSFSSGGLKSGGFKSGSFSSGSSSKSGGFKSGSFSSGGGLFGGSKSSGSKSYSSGSGNTYIPIPIPSWGWHSSHYSAASVAGSIAGGFIKFILFIVVAAVIYNIIKKSRRY